MGDCLLAGEALGLRRSDLHLLPDSRCVGCAVLGAHVHVRHRANPNGALAKSRFPRTMPASDAVLSSYADHQHERAEILGEDDCDMVFVNLRRGPLGAPMTYRAAKRLFERLARDCGFAVRLHMFRHTAATNWEGRGVASDATFRVGREDGAVGGCGSGRGGTAIGATWRNPQARTAVTGYCRVRCQDVASTLVASDAGMPDIERSFMQDLGGI